MSDQNIEQIIQANNLTAPRVSYADVVANIKHTEIHTYVTQSGQVMRWALLTLQNGYAVVGRPSVAVSPENDNIEVGEQVARENSFNEIWPLMGYELKERLYRDSQPASPSAREVELEELLRSACAIAERKGESTAWDRFVASANKLGLNGITARTYRVLPSDVAEHAVPPSDGSRTRYIGTKIVTAEPMNRGAYNMLRGWDLPADENGADEGYVVEYQDGGKPNVKGVAGYVSWSPKAQFEAAYQVRPLVPGLAPHQQRVVDELAELRDKLTKLDTFSGTSIFAELPEAEKGRLYSQHGAMSGYAAILAERIAAFAGSAA